MKKFTFLFALAFLLSTMTMNYTLADATAEPKVTAAPAKKDGLMKRMKGLLSRNKATDAEPENTLDDGEQGRDDADALQSEAKEGAAVTKKKGGLLNRFSKKKQKEESPAEPQDVLALIESNWDKNPVKLMFSTCDSMNHIMGRLSKGWLSDQCIQTFCTTVCAKPGCEFYDQDTTRNTLKACAALCADGVQIEDSASLNVIKGCINSRLKGDDLNRVRNLWQTRLGGTLAEESFVEDNFVNMDQGRRSDAARALKRAREKSKEASKSGSSKKNLSKHTKEALSKYKAAVKNWEKAVVAYWKHRQKIRELLSDLIETSKVAAMEREFAEKTAKVPEKLLDKAEKDGRESMHGKGNRWFRRTGKVTDRGRLLTTFPRKDNRDALLKEALEGLVNEEERRDLELQVRIKPNLGKLRVATQMTGMSEVVRRRQVAAGKFTQAGQVTSMVRRLAKRAKAGAEQPAAVEAVGGVEPAPAIGRAESMRNAPTEASRQAVPPMRKALPQGSLSRTTAQQELNSVYDKVHGEGGAAWAVTQDGKLAISKLSSNVSSLRDPESQEKLKAIVRKLEELNISNPIVNTLRDRLSSQYT